MAKAKSDHYTNLVSNNTEKLRQLRKTSLKHQLYLKMFIAICFILPATFRVLFLLIMYDITEGSVTHITVSILLNV